MSDADAFIERIVAEPEDDGHWLVYADWLIERGDPRGEAINLALAIERGTERVGDAEFELMGLHGDRDRILSPRLMERYHRWDIELWRGFIRGADGHDRQDVDDIAALCTDPHVGLLRRLDVFPESAAALAPLFEAPRRHLTKLRTWGLSHHAERLDRMIPRLEELVFEGPIDEGEWRLEHRNLRKIVGGTQAARGIITGDFHLPRLESLLWQVDDDELVAGHRSIAYAPPSTLANVDLTAYGESAVVELVVALADAPMIANAKRLRLGALEVPGLELLLVNAARFEHLEELCLRVESQYPGEEVQPTYPDAAFLAAYRERLARALPRTRCVITPHYTDVEEACEEV